DVKLNLYGSLSIPRNNPNYFGELYAEYNFTKEILRGSLHSNIMLPAQTGSIILAKEMKMEYYSDKNGYSMSSTNIQATVLGLMEFSGTFDFTKPTQGVLTGIASGSLTMEQDYKVAADIVVGDIEAGLELKFEALTQLKITETDISGEFSSTIEGTAYLQFSNSLLGTTRLGASYSGEAEFKRENQINTLTGNFILQFEAMGKNISHQENINLTL
ncbi:MAG: hypothetical protein OEW75_17720, partial [Cyclobacteriaceae bacterium]|nr:hypothetical protein [Cyclobacteriaceae bacterium]